MKAGKDDKSKCTVQAKAGRNGKVVFATLSPLGFLFPMHLILEAYVLQQYRGRPKYLLLYSQNNLYYAKANFQIYWAGANVFLSQLFTSILTGTDYC